MDINRSLIGVSIISSSAHHFCSSSRAECSLLIGLEDTAIWIQAELELEDIGLVLLDLLEEGHEELLLLDDKASAFTCLGRPEWCTDSLHFVRACGDVVRQGDGRRRRGARISWRTHRRCSDEHHRQIRKLQTHSEGM